MKRKLLKLVIGSVCALGTQVALAVPSFVSAVPNGSTFSCSTCHTAAPAFNSFGQAFFNNGEVWNATLAHLDSDGDTFSNGQELGDPNGTWTPGSPNPPGPVFGPGDPNSHPTAVTPPTITTQPVSQTVTAGANVTFTVVAAGTAPLSYQWRKTGAPISGATTSALTLTSVTTADNGTYSVVVTNAAGSVTSAGATLTVSPAPVSISVALSSPTNGANFTAPASFSLVADVSPINSISRVEFFRGTTSLGSLSAPPFSLPVANLGAGTYTFTARATSTSGAVSNSAPVTITVTTPPGPTGPAVVTVTAVDPNAAEAGPDPGTFRIARTGPTTNDLTVFFLLGGTAVNGLDFQTVTNVVTIPTGSATVNIAINPVADNDSPPEVSDTVILQLTSAPDGFPGYDIGSPSNAVVTIQELVTTSGNLPPVVSIVAPRNGATFRAGSSILLAARASDPDGTVVKVEFFAGTTSLGVATAVRGGGDDDDGEEGGTTGLYTLVWRNAPAGQYVLTAVATDNQGATTISNPVTITVRSARRSGGDDRERSSSRSGGDRGED